MDHSSKHTLVEPSSAEETETETSTEGTEERQRETRRERDREGERERNYSGKSQRLELIEVPLKIHFSNKMYDRILYIVCVYYVLSMTESVHQTQSPISSCCRGDKIKKQALGRLGQDGPKQQCRKRDKITVSGRGDIMARESPEGQSCLLYTSPSPRD